MENAHFIPESLQLQRVNSGSRETLQAGRRDQGSETLTSRLVIDFTPFPVQNSPHIWWKFWEPSPLSRLIARCLILFSFSTQLLPSSHSGHSDTRILGDIIKEPLRCFHQRTVPPRQPPAVCAGGLLRGPFMSQSPSVFKGRRWVGRTGSLSSLPPRLSSHCSFTGHHLRWWKSRATRHPRYWDVR